GGREGHGISSRWVLRGAAILDPKKDGRQHAIHDLDMWCGGRLPPRTLTSEPSAVSRHGRGKSTPTGLPGLGEAQQVARRVAETAVPDAVRLVDRLLDHLGAR